MIISELLFKMKYHRADPYEKADLYKKRYGINMGDRCKFFGRADFGSEPYLIRLGNDVMLSDGVQFSNHDGGVQVLDVNGMLPKADIFGPIVIGNNVFIGRNSMIMKDVHIGSNVVIGAGSIVTRDCESNSVYAGIPARKIRTLDEYCEKVKNRAVPTLDYTKEEKKKYLIKKYNLESEQRGVK